MRKEWMIAIIAGLLLIIGILFGIYVYQRNNTKDSNMPENSQLAFTEENETVENNLVPTVVLERKVSPNATLTKQQYFTGCNHLITTVEKLPENFANCSEEELKEKCTGWSIEKFENDEIVLFQEQEGFCNEHYLIKPHNNVLAIYTTDEKGNETWKEDTDIQTMYLTEADLLRVEEGIEAIGSAELHTVLEDFE